MRKDSKEAEAAERKTDRIRLQPHTAVPAQMERKNLLFRMRERSKGREMRMRGEIRQKNRHNTSKTQTSDSKLVFRNHHNGRRRTDTQALHSDKESIDRGKTGIRQLRMYKELHQRERTDSRTITPSKKALLELGMEHDERNSDAEREKRKGEVQHPQHHGLV